MRPLPASRLVRHGGGWLLTLRASEGGRLHVAVWSQAKRHAIDHRDLDLPPECAVSAFILRGRDDTVPPTADITLAIPAGAEDESDTHFLQLVLSDGRGDHIWSRFYLLHCPEGQRRAAAGRFQAITAPVGTERHSVPPLPHRGTVRIVARDVWERDAVGNFCFSLLRLMIANGVPAALYAENFDPTYDGLIRHEDDLGDEVGSDDILLVNVSTFDPQLTHIAALPNRKLAYFHNITPPGFFTSWDIGTAKVIEAGYGQLPLLSAFDAVIANSTASLDVAGPHLRSACPTFVAPPFIARRQRHAPTGQGIPCPSFAPQPYLLAVGRIAPNKGLRDLVALFAAIHRTQPHMRLIVAGGDAIASYAEVVRGEAGEVGSSIQFAGVVTDETLDALYANAAGFISMSEHEGFCVPIVEAMAHDIPLFVRDEPAMRETAGAAAMVLAGSDWEHLAGVVLHGIEDQKSQDWRFRRQRRLREIDEAADGATILQALMLVAGLG